MVLPPPIESGITSIWRKPRLLKAVEILSQSVTRFPLSCLFSSSSSSATEARTARGVLLHLEDAFNPGNRHPVGATLETVYKIVQLKSLHATREESFCRRPSSPSDFRPFFSIAFRHERAMKSSSEPSGALSHGLARHYMYCQPFHKGMIGQGTGAIKDEVGLDLTTGLEVKGRLLPDGLDCSRSLRMRIATFGSAV